MGSSGMSRDSSSVTGGLRSGSNSPGSGAIFVVRLVVVRWWDVCLGRCCSTNAKMGRSDSNWVLSLSMHRWLYERTNAGPPPKVCPGHRWHIQEDCISEWCHLVSPVPVVTLGLFTSIAHRERRKKSVHSISAWHDRRLVAETLAQTSVTALVELAQTKHKRVYAHKALCLH
jgi:hypothetical protein